MTIISRRFLHRLAWGIGAALTCLVFSSSVLAGSVILFEDFEDGILDPRITVETVGSFNSWPGIKDVADFGSNKAFGYGRSTCGASCFDGYVTNFRITFPEPIFVATISFKEMELYGNWGSKGKIFIDGNPLTWGDYNANEDFGRQPSNDRQQDTAYRLQSYEVNRKVTTIELKVLDITLSSEIFIDDVEIETSSFDDHPMPVCRTVLLSEDFESYEAGTWIGYCDGWQTWANGSNQSSFFITDQQYVSGTKGLQVSGLGSCWEGSAYYQLTGTHVLLQAMMKASGDGPNGCHHYQNGIEINAAGWSFNMPQGDSEGGLSCFVTGGGAFTAVPGFQNAAGRWYAVAIELDYDSGMAYFWLDGQPVWSTSFDTQIAVSRVWLRSGEGWGWFDDVNVCEVLPPGEKSVSLDIKPGSCPNPFNIKWMKNINRGNGKGKSRKGGIVPAALVGNNGFDVTEIDVSTLLLEGISPVRYGYEDVTRAAVGEEQCSCTEDGPDGFIDLTLKFNRQELAEAIGTVGDGSEVVLTLTGAMMDGTAFEASDCIIIRNERPDLPWIQSNLEAQLEPAKPNPFNSATSISLTLPERTQANLSIYNIEGRLVKTLVNRTLDEGSKRYSWDGTDSRGNPVAAGVYFYRLKAGNKVLTKKVVFIR